MRAVVAVAGRRQGNRPIRKARRPAASREIGSLISPARGGHLISPAKRGHLISPARGGHLISPAKRGPPTKREPADRLTSWAARTATHLIVGCG
jgi:hypothetical protein